MAAFQTKLPLLIVVLFFNDRQPDFALIALSLLVSLEIYLNVRCIGVFITGIGKPLSDNALL